jgi:hypothetical protein
MTNRSIVRVGQVVRALAGAVISTGTFEHDCLIEDRLIMQLDMEDCTVYAGSRPAPR